MRSANTASTLFTRRASSRPAVYAAIQGDRRARSTFPSRLTASFAVATLQAAKKLLHTPMKSSPEEKANTLPVCHLLTIDGIASQRAHACFALRQPDNLMLNALLENLHDAFLEHFPRHQHQARQEKQGQASEPARQAAPLAQFLNAVPRGPRLWSMPAMRTPARPNAASLSNAARTAAARSWLIVTGVA